MSYKLRADQIRTINKEKYRFSVNGLGWNTVDEMLKMGTYNALIGDSELYKASESDFSDSHKLFKRTIGTFSWEVLEVYSGPPVVAFKWRYVPGNGQDRLPPHHHHVNPLERYWNPNIALFFFSFFFSLLLLLFQPLGQDDRRFVCQARKRQEVGGCCQQ